MLVPKSDQEAVDALTGTAGAVSIAMLFVAAISACKGSSSGRMAVSGGGGAGETGGTGATIAHGGGGTSNLGGTPASTGGNPSAGTAGVGGASIVATDANDADLSSVQDAAAPPTDGGTLDGAGWKLVWSDDFDQAICPDSANWGYEHGLVRNHELQYYQPNNASCQGGILIIEARRETVQTAAYSSASMITSSKKMFTYGRFEMRGRIPTALGSWPAFWTLGIGGWPQSGEVDIMEYYTGNVLANVCKPAGGTCAWSSIRQPLAGLGADAWTSQFHVWAMEWDAQNIDLSLDGKLVNHFPVSGAVAAGQANPYVGHPMYIILNLAIGGDNGGDPTNTTFPLHFEVDYVRVYQRATGP
jgi:beta-glucanase (GH16 family)